MYIVEQDGQRTTIRVEKRAPWFVMPRRWWGHLHRLGVDLWQHRELIRNLVVRDLKVRYKNSALGIIWSLLNPLLMVLVFTAVFTVMQGVAIENFPVFVLVGLLPWQFFANSVMAATTSIVANANLINKIYFPREILVISGVLSNLVNFLIALLVMVPVLLVFHTPLTVWLLMLPIMILIQLIFTLGIGFIVATANVFYRDVLMIMDVALLAGFFLTPIFYPLSTLPRSYELFGINLDVWRLMYIFNPMASIIANYRIVLVYGAPPALDFLLRTLMTALLFLAVGLAVFYRYKHRFGEEI